MKIYKVCNTLLSIFFVTVSGVLFWQGFDPIFEGLDEGMPFWYVLLINILMSGANIIGALFCLLYAIMPWLTSRNGEC